MIHSTVRRAGCVALAAGLASPGAADVIVLNPVKDNTLFSLGATSNGIGDTLFCGQTGMSVKQRAVLAFDVAGHVAPGSTITAATLTLTLYQQGPNGASQVLALHRLLADWGEGASATPQGTGAPAAPGDATWFHTFFPDEFWAVPGADFSAVESASLGGMGAPGPYSWGSNLQMIADVQGWLDDPASDHGWLLQSGEVDLNTSKKFWSRETSPPENRPALTIAFTPPCPGDCGSRDGTVDTLDFLALLSQWGQSGGGCDLGLGGPGVGTEDFLGLLENWGACR